MAPLSRLMVICILYYIGANSETTSEKKTNNVLAIISNDFKIGDNLIHIPLLLAPVIFLPFPSEKESKIPKPYIDADLKESPEDTLSNVSDIEVNFRQSLDRGIKRIKQRSELNKLNTSNSNNTKNYTTHNRTVTKFSENFIKINLTAVGNATTHINRVERTTEALIDIKSYPPSVSNMDFNSLRLTTETNDETKLLPSQDDERWKQFNDTTKYITVENKPETTTEPIMEATDKGPYPSAVYNKNMIDQVSITTNSYTNGKSPSLPRGDRWDTFSSLAVPKSNGFKPLAGLYYDGFLHRPLVKMTGFVPYTNYY